MGRGRAKKTKVSSGTDHEDPGSHEEKVHVPKRRGRPQKAKGEIVAVEFCNKLEEEGLHDDDANGALSKKMKSCEEAEENGKMGRKQNSLLKEETNGYSNDHNAEAKSSSEDLTKMNGFRHSGSRRKSRPHRAAEVGVECQWNGF